MQMQRRPHVFVGIHFAVGRIDALSQDADKNIHRLHAHCVSIGVAVPCAIPTNDIAADVIVARLTMIDPALSISSHQG